MKENRLLVLRSLRASPAAGWSLRRSIMPEALTRRGRGAACRGKGRGVALVVNLAQHTLRHWRFVRSSHGSVSTVIRWHDSP